MVKSTVASYNAHEDKVEDATAVMQRQVRNSQTIQRIVRIPRFSTSSSRRFPDRVR